MSRQPGPRIDPPMDPRIDPDGKRLPIKLDSTSNGEFVPVPLSGTNRAANRLAHEAASDFSKKLGFTRRKFLVSSCGAASTLLAAPQEETRNFLRVNPNFFEKSEAASCAKRLAARLVPESGTGTNSPLEVLSSLIGRRLPSGSMRGSIGGSIRGPG